MKETVRYTYRLRPGVAAERALVSEWHRTRFLWNDAVERMRSGEKISLTTLGKRLTALRAEHDWLREGSQNAQQQELHTFAQSFSQSFTVKGRGRPKFKSAKKAHPSLGYTRNGFSIRNDRLRLPGKVTIPVVWHRDLPSEPSSVRVYRDSLGHWYASFVVKRERPAPEPTTGRSIGIDWGVSTTATTTDPAYDLPHGGNRRKVAAQIAHAQRRMARRYRPGQTQSKGYKRAKREAAVVAKKAQRRNTHDGRVWAKKIVLDHDLIAVEDFRPKFLAKSTMARKAADAAVSTTKRTLIESAERAGRKVVLVQPAYTTMTCHGCFARNKRLELGVRTFVCTACGLTVGRDTNAARTILAVAERGHTSVDGVRHLLPPSGGEAGAA